MKNETAGLQWPSLLTATALPHEASTPEPGDKSLFVGLTTQHDWPVGPASLPRTPELLFLKGIMQAPWWPRGLGVIVDDPAERFVVQPEAGARSFLRIERDESSWNSDSGARWAPASGQGFLYVLLAGVRSEISGLATDSVRSLPRHPDDLRLDLRRIGKSATFGSPISITGMPRPTGKRFAPYEEIGVWSPLPASKAPRACVSTLKGVVAQTLGAFIAERLGDPTPRPLAGEPFDRLEALLASPEPPTKWMLRVDGCGRRVELMVEAGGRSCTLGSVASLDAGAPPVAVRLDPSDDLGATMEGLRRRMDARLVELDPSPTLSAKQGQLSSVPDVGRIHLLGHGGRSDDWTDREGGFTVTSMGSLSAQALANRLVAEGLPPSFRGTIYLEGCHVGSGNQRADVYARAVRDALAAGGRTGVTVAGRPGRTVMLPRLSMTLPDVVGFEIAATDARALAQVRLAESRLDIDSTDGRVAAEAALKRARDWYALTQGAMRVMIESADEAHKKMDTLTVREMWARFGPATGAHSPKKSSR